MQMNLLKSESALHFIQTIFNSSLKHRLDGRNTDTHKSSMLIISMRKADFNLDNQLVFYVVKYQYFARQNP